jgi:hypothetical protein
MTEGVINNVIGDAESQEICKISFTTTHLGASSAYRIIEYEMKPFCVQNSNAAWPSLGI